MVDIDQASHDDGKQDGEKYREHESELNGSCTPVTPIVAGGTLD